MPTNKDINRLIQRAAELAEFKMPVLRSIASYNCDTQAEALRMNRFFGRKRLIADILYAEFSDLLTENL